MIYFGDAVPATVTAPISSGWFDGDFWLSLWAQGDLEQQVMTLNNYFQNLWRSAGVVGISSRSPFGVQLDSHMAQFVQWLGEYHEAQLRRALPFASSRDWEEELRGYKAKFEADFAWLEQLGGAAAKTELAKRGTDPATIIIPQSPGQQFTKAAASIAQSGSSLLSQVASSQWFWPSLLGVALVGAGIYVTRAARS